MSGSSPKQTLFYLFQCMACCFVVYVAGYFWFRQSHTTTYPSSGTIPFTLISTSLSDSALLAMFYPALCLDAKFGSDRVYFRTDTSGDMVPRYHRYPFVHETEPSDDSPAPAQVPDR